MSILFFICGFASVIKILLATPKAFGGLLAVGLGLSICVQALIHMAVNVKVFSSDWFAFAFGEHGWDIYVVFCYFSGDYFKC